ncbi:MAG TPA: lysophospholipid acyltransferase family protein [Anaerolineae bacterium]|nr:lysophospholipid acyltransferase family protein [Anaerolineae bacterium]HQK13479.1 lysophospholipid acyltransferase family protein [Anaerolineae bacterium]
MAEEFKYPRRRLIRGLVQRATRLIFNVLTDFHILGAENFPKSGPLLVVANHFSFVDPMAMVRIAPWPMEFLGGFRTPNAPPLLSWIRELWGYYPVFRGTGSTLAIRAASAVLRQNGVLGIFPEGTSAAAVLRPPRPGAAFIATLTNARILPVGLDGFIDVLPRLGRGKRARVTAHIGQPFGPFMASGRGRERREYLEQIGHEIMRHIAELLPPERRGHYSDDPVIRAAAQGTEYYPFDDEPEM